MAEIDIDYLNTMAPVSGFNIGGNILSYVGEKEGQALTPICH